MQDVSETTLTFLLTWQGRCTICMLVQELPVPALKAQCTSCPSQPPVGLRVAQQQVINPAFHIWCSLVQFIKHALPILPLKGQLATVAQEPLHSCLCSHTLQPHLLTKHLPSTPWTSISVLHRITHHICCQLSHSYFETLHSSAVPANSSCSLSFRIQIALPLF